eukprot:8474068-Pyramimonas_sp.AAC.1
MHTDVATFSRFPGCDDGRHDALPPSLSHSLTLTPPLPTAGRPISFSPGDAGQSGIALGDARRAGGEGPTPEHANPPMDPGPRRQTDEGQRDALG